MPGCLPTPVCSYCLPKLTSSMFPHCLCSTVVVVLHFTCHVNNTLISGLSYMCTCSSPINAKKVNSLNSSDSYIGLWRNYLILCCSSASSSSMCSSSSTSGSVRCSPPETLASTPDSSYSYDSKVRSNSLCTHIYKVLNIKRHIAYYQFLKRFGICPENEENVMQHDRRPT